MVTMKVILTSSLGGQVKIDGKRQMLPMYLILNLARALAYLKESLVIYGNAFAAFLDNLNEENWYEHFRDDNAVIYPIDT